MAASKKFMKFNVKLKTGKSITHRKTYLTEEESL